MALIVTVVMAVTAIAAVTRWHTRSATALGKVSAMISVAATIADAWSKTQVIGRQFAADPAGFTHKVSTTPSQERPAPRREPDDDDLNDLFSDRPAFRTGGLRGYSAYTPVR